MKHIIGIFLFFCLSGFAMNLVSPTEVPQAEITNGLIKVKVYLPDAENGYYRGTRFDWSGVIPSLQYAGHTFHGQWFDRYNPTNHDAVMGPVEEFGPVGYEASIPGGNFVKIGIGSLIKPEESSYSSYKLYSIANRGTWTVKKKSDEIQFIHILNDSVYSYEYSKTIKLVKGKAEMILLHSLKNTGKRSLETSVYNHNFFVIDQQTAGPGYRITLPYNSLSSEGGKGIGDLVTINDHGLSFLRDLEKKEQVYFPDLTRGTTVPYEFRIENIKSGAGVSVKGNRPISKLVFWSASTTVSPEPYIDIKIEPGATFTWNIAYKYHVGLKVDESKSN
jgi:hypothetical protein